MQKLPQVFMSLLEVCECFVDGLHIQTNLNIIQDCKSWQVAHTFRLKANNSLHKVARKFTLWVFWCVLAHASRSEHTIKLARACTCLQGRLLILVCGLVHDITHTFRLKACNSLPKVAKKPAVFVLILCGVLAHASRLIEQYLQELFILLNL